MNNQNQPEWINELYQKLPVKLHEFLKMRDGGALLAQSLPDYYSPIELINKNDNVRGWELAGLFFQNSGRFYEAITIYFALYYHLLAAQIEKGERIHKGMPLCWISDCFYNLGCRTLGKRYLMLTLCEDAITYPNGVISKDSSGVYPRLVILQGMPEKEFNRYAKQIHSLSKENDFSSFYPEFFLQEIDSLWMTEIVTENEITRYYVNKFYIENLINLLGDKQGKTLERLSGYILSCMPGCRISIRKKTKSTDLDVIGTLEGNFVDFRSELGRYFLCEAKDWETVVNSSIIKEFATVLDTCKMKFGIIISKHGISGTSVDKDAERDIRDKFQRDSVAILSLNLEDIILVKDGANLVTILRDKYEKLKLDIYSSL